MYDCIVHEQDDLLLTLLFVSANMPECLVDEVLKEYSIESSLNDLTAHNLVLAYSSDEAQRELLLLHSTLSNRELSHFHSMFTQVLSKLCFELRYRFVKQLDFVILSFALPLFSLYSKMT